MFQIVIGAQRGMHGAGPQGENDELVVVGTGDERGEVLILFEVAVEEDQLLLAMGGVIDGIQIEGEMPGRCREGGNELIDEKVTKPFERTNADGVLEA